jgi:hypothetical protein
MGCREAAGGEGACRGTKGGTPIAGTTTGMPPIGTPAGTSYLRDIRRTWELAGLRHGRSGNERLCFCVGQGGGSLPGLVGSL